MKAVLISIKPEWCNLILSGKKTVEVRKTFPHDHMPFKCYIYCTKPSIKDPHKLLEIYSDDKIYKANGKVVAEFVCDRFSVEYLSSFPMKDACMDWNDAENYLGLNSNRELYAWHISNLKVYDKPKELHDFKKPRESRCLLELKKDADCLDCKHWNFEGEYCTERFTSQVSRPPQSWMYVEELEE